MAVKLELTPTRLCDVWAFERMRPADAAEVMASGGYSPVEAIIESWHDSRETWTARFNGEVACMFGVAVHPAGTELVPIGIAWLLTTNVVDKYPVAFYKACTRAVRDLHARYGPLMNYVDARHKQALGWAARLGFEVQPAIPFGKQGEPFHPIIYRS